MKRFLRIAGIAVAVLVVAALALPFFINANQFRPVLEERLSTALGREVKIGDLKISLFSGGASASDVTIADDPAFSKDPFLRAKDLAVGVELPGCRQSHAALDIVPQGSPWPESSPRFQATSSSRIIWKAHW